MPDKIINCREIICHLNTVFDLNPYLSSYAWKVQAGSGRIVLRGRVHHPAIAALAETITYDLYGEDYVIDNRVVVDPVLTGPARRSALFQHMEDLNTLTSIRIKFDLNQYTHLSQIDLKVASRYVVLSGTVRDKLTKYFAGELAYDTFGIDNLANHLEIDPAGQTRLDSTSPYLKTPVSNLKIMLVLSRRFSSLPLHISQNGDAVSLAGEVNDDLTKKRLEKIASSVLGINRVETRMVSTKKAAYP